MLVRIAGGLGNQLFQYAAGEMLRLTAGEKVKYETFSYLRDKKRTLQLGEFNVRGVGKTRSAKSFFYYFLARFARMTGNTAKWDARFGILRDELATGLTEKKLRGKKYLVGYWQNTDNLELIREELKKQFRCKNEYPGSKEMLDFIRGNHAVAMHVRRGDYLQGDNSGVYAGCAPEYYESAMEYMRKRVEAPVFVVFSNDISWCKENLRGSDIRYVDEQYSSSDINDFYLMRECEHFIIANSTFSWWASWLGESEEKIVVAPEHWFLDAEKNRQVQEALLKGAVLM